MKYYLSIALVLILFSCKREIAIKQFKQKELFAFPMRNAEQVVASTNQKIEAPKIEDKSSSANAAATPPNHLAKQTNKVKSFQLKENTNTNFPSNEFTITKKEKKEMNPRLSRALVMTIFGGLATGLGIAFFKYAPTGLFIFAFGIVFLVGIISLIMYLADPKPKL